MLQLLPTVGAQRTICHVCSDVEVNARGRREQCDNHTTCGKCLNYHNFIRLQMCLGIRLRFHPSFLCRWNHSLGHKIAGHGVISAHTADVMRHATDSVGEDSSNVSPSRSSCAELIPFPNSQFEIPKTESFRIPTYSRFQAITSLAVHY